MDFGIMRGTISIVSGVVAVGVLLLGTVDLRASHDPFGGDSVLLHEDDNSVADIWRDELARIAIDQTLCPIATQRLS
jgi:hypothetical protein